MAQKIIDLDAAMPEDVGVRMGGEVYPLPGDIAIPDYLELERLLNAVDNPEELEEGEEAPFKQLYDFVLELFQIRTPDLEKLPIGAQQLGSLVVQLYSGAAAADEEESAPPQRPARNGTRSTSSRRKRSRGSKS